MLLMHTYLALTVNLLLYMVLRRPYVCLLALLGEMVAQLVVAKIVSELDSRGELECSCRASLGG